MSTRHKLFLWFINFFFQYTLFIRCVYCIMLSGWFVFISLHLWLLSSLLWLCENDSNIQTKHWIYLWDARKKKIIIIEILCISIHWRSHRMCFLSNFVFFVVFLYSFKIVGKRQEYPLEVKLCEWKRKVDYNKSWLLHKWITICMLPCYTFIRSIAFEVR